MNTALRQYLVITGNYWAFTLTDGALRMLVVLHFHQLGYSPLEIAMLFLFYEFFGVVTNLVGGYLGARIGLNRTMNLGLALQVLALAMLAVPASALTVPWVMAAQALSGIAKDLNKMSAKTGIKLLVSDANQGKLYKWVALLTGSKNTLKGVGFFLGGLLLMTAGFRGAVVLMASALLLVWLSSLFLLTQELGKSKAKPKFTEILSKNRAINVLSAARLFLFGARDVWFVVALPVYLHTVFGWDFWKVGGFMATWVIGYGFIQTIAPRLTGNPEDKKPVVLWAGLLALVPAVIATGLMAGIAPQLAIVGGLLLFGVLFAINSSLHSYLIVSYAREDGASLDVGFYYMSNAAGRLLGTILSGWVYQAYGLGACLWVSSGLITLAALFAAWLPDQRTAPA
ncbi:organoarsenical effux MFS transporter ArsJ [Marinobacter sediminum]|uniref:organoarsenical effux MFS transporter ArsJ n=1 Tax=Marinobacter sediminum TaxID=256323 RepID=UPI00202F02A2|nr:organoarsenical effux MFS transporter ArsJ [Marinobacter sediminum]MCM0613668.1 organoarsenical effux MFS transporter ArsJ [Marinobacter sediminum]